ncbi:MAG: hypothetical protein LBB23_01980 [Rickettsiales bacterium]|jgi:hypothetical protein|nr:hypothetical protein [Rickettsiales bacterium]
MQTDIYKYTPELAKMAAAPTLKNHYDTAFRNINAISAADFPDRPLMLECIYNEARRLYRDAVALDVVNQLIEFPVAETGTHISFTKRKNQNGDAPMIKNVLLSAAYNASRGLDMHISFSGSNIKLSNDDAPGHIQIGSQIIPIASRKTLNQNFAYGFPKLDKEFLNVNLLHAVEYKMMWNSMTNEERSANTKIASLFQGQISDYASWTRFVQNVKFSKNVADMSARVLQDYPLSDRTGFSCDKIRDEYDRLLAANEDAQDISDCAAFQTSFALSKILRPLNVNQITLDFTKIARRFIERSRENPESPFTRAIADPEFIKGLERAFWIGNSAKIDEETNMPGSAIMMAACLFSGLVPHGGRLQSIYGADVRDAVAKFCRGTEMADAVRLMPVETMFTHRYKLMNGDKNLEALDLEDLHADDRAVLLSSVLGRSGQSVAEYAAETGAPSLSENTKMMIENHLNQRCR